jgi:drug/metabolite transporter (DMT)-like permease
MSVPAAYLGVIIIWSTTPLAIKWSSEASILFGITGRMVLGALLCLLIIAIMRIEFPWHRKARWSYLAISISIYGAMMSTYWGAQFISSGLISVLFGFSPIITSMLTVIWLNNHRISFNQWAGMSLGIIGLGFIFQSELNMGTDGIKGLLAVLLAVFLHSSSAVWVKRLNVSISPLAMTCGGLLVSLPFYGITWLLLGESLPPTLPPHTLLSMLYLGIFGSVLGFIFYYYILKHIEANRVALITLITPIIALFLGQNLNGEVVHVSVWIGTGIVLTGLALYQFGNR